MRVVAKPFQELPHVLVHVRVERDVVHELVVLLLGGQLSLPEQPRHFEESRRLSELFDGISAIAKNALVAVDEGDRAAT